MILPRRPRTFVIHVPKCAGTYLLRHHFNGTQVRRSLFRKVWYRGHIRVRDLGVRRIDSLVATIRNPWDWYSSYYHFLIKEIDPTNHPIRILSGDYDSFSTLTDNLSSPRFLDEKEDVSPIIYEDLAPDIFPFMKRTGTGFWTWTVLFHLSCKDTEEFNCLNDVLTEIRTIRSRVGFPAPGTHGPGCRHSARLQNRTREASECFSQHLENERG